LKDTVSPELIPEPAPELAGQLLDWYDRHRRVLPWRSSPGEFSDPYRVWLSEIMLQQTTVQSVIPYFLDFTRRWPSVEALAAEPLDNVLTAWAGLGYYARARNLHACARAVAEGGGRFPDTEEGLRQLPGIGDYTAAAIAAIAYGKPAAVMDGNVERVMARMFAVTEPLPQSKPRLKALTAEMTPNFRPGDYAQAVMDLGAGLCSPRSPACGVCPWMAACRGRAMGIAADLPVKAPKAEKPTRFGMAFFARRADGAILLRRRPEKGLLGGMMEVPSTPWTADKGGADSWTVETALAHAPIGAAWSALGGEVRHTFTHFHLVVRLVWAKAERTQQGQIWARPHELDDHALPTVMKKIIRHGLERTEG
jgi:A/G-specific adenine glycosylase